MRLSPEAAAACLVAGLCTGLVLCAWGLGVIGPRGSGPLVAFGLILSWASLRMFEANRPR